MYTQSHREEMATHDLQCPHIELLTKYMSINDLDIEHNDQIFKF